MLSQALPARSTPYSRGPNRRAILKGTGGLLIGSAAAALAGCAAPPPEAEPFDPRSLVYPPPPEQARYYYEMTLWGSGSVIEETSTDRFRRFATGESLRGKGFAKPFGVVARNGRVYVSDTVNREVHALDLVQKRYFELGRKGVGRLLKPLGMAMDAAGMLYVVDGSAQRVLIYDAEGNYVTSVGVNKELERPSGVAVTPDGQRIYAVDTGGVRSTNHQVVVFDPAGRVIQTIGGRGTGNGEFNLPLDCCLGPDGRLYVVDTGNFRIQVFSPDGTFERSFGAAGRYPGQFGHPKSIAVGADGIIYVTDTNFGIFQLFDNNGQILMWVGERSEKGGPGKFILPAGISIDVDGRIYVVDQFFQRVDVFRPASLPEDWPVGQKVA